MSMTITRLGTPTWIAARPIPGAAYIVSSMSSISARRSSSTVVTGFDTCFSSGSGTTRISRNAMAAELGARYPSVKVGQWSRDASAFLAGHQPHLRRALFDELGQRPHAGLYG